MLKTGLEKVHRTIVTVSLVLLAGCLARNAPPVNYYSLLSIDQIGGFQPLTQKSEVLLGIGPITIVESLRRSQIVTRTSNNVYKFDEYNKWAGPLEKDVASTLGDAISFFTGAGGIDHFPWMPYFRPTHRIVIDIERFDGQLGGQAVLHARWNLLSGDGKLTLASSKFRQSKMVDGTRYGDLVRAESELLAELSQEISRIVVQ